MIGIPRFPGTNCEMETFHWVSDNLESTPVFLDEKLPAEVDAIIIPGGFSHGDYLRAGALSARSEQMNYVKEKAKSGTPVLGICNGFQILCESHLLPGVLVKNVTKKHHHFSVALKCDYSQKNVWLPQSLSKITEFNLPMSCGMGKYLSKGPVKSFLKYTHNENGSDDAIAGICNTEGNVVGMMPHPERASDIVLGSDIGFLFLAGLAENTKIKVKEKSPLWDFMQNRGLK